jgi:hypothetical protein
MDTRRHKVVVEAIKLIRPDPADCGYSDDIATDFLSKLHEATRQPKDLCQEVICDLVIDDILRIAGVNSTEVWYCRHSEWESNLETLEKALHL